MDTINIENDIEELLEIPLALSYSSLIIEILASVVILVALILIFKNSQRPGRIMMLFGYVFSLFSYVPLMMYFLSTDGGGQSGVLAWFTYYLPMASSMFMLVACGGLLMFALSFKNES
ncbi:hypothetical protein GCM10008090_34990 [Arenicella chitinivorans]|uniref:Uncharacterized protein n=1 Tax=Arenicella chitinivorans TaxID=1329800 RepID=A0A918VT06_9GAMM|nr:hypothetical protein [Arenicella chitinivorans]GHA22152.1 hypothetical protein GCM10008090_34990 [Arenicella chitinivorans]